MTRKPKKCVVVALGGSIVYPESIDTQFIKNFRTLIRKFLKKKFQFVIVVGGGRLSRVFQDAAHKISRINDEDKDWIGIHATRLNAHLLRTVFRDVAEPVIFDGRHKMKKLRCPLTIASGWRPGWSTDYVAVRLAADFGAKKVIVAGKPAFVYDKDPHTFKDARAIENLSWKEYRKLIPPMWKPGLHAPVDPVAARLGEKEGIKAIIVNGKDLKNFENLLNGKEFRGTVIE